MLLVTFNAFYFFVLFWSPVLITYVVVIIGFKNYIFNKIHPQEYMPLPPGDEEEKSTEENPEPKFQFSYVECLIFTFHQLAKKVNMYTIDV